MLSTTIENELGAYRIGEKVRELRKERGLKLVELGDHTGLSAAMLSKIESGKVVPTLPTLTRIGLAFSVGLDHFFSDERNRHAYGITRKGERIRMPGADKMPYDFENMDYTVHEPRLRTYLAHFKDADTPPEHDHSGIEFIYVTQGRLELTWKGHKEILEAGDSAYFDASIEHAYRRLGTQPCTGVVVTLQT